MHWEENALQSARRFPNECKLPRKSTPHTAMLVYLLIYWTQGPPGLRESVPPPWPVRLRVLAILDHLGPQISKNLKKRGQYEKKSHFWDIFWIFRKNLKKSFWTMFLYRVKYNESESDIQNNDLLYKTHQKY